MTAPAPLEVQLTTVETLDICDLTDLEIDGSGVLDRLLTLMRKHLEREYKSGRITGNDYSNVFITAYTATMQQAMTFTIEKEKQAYELRKLEAEAKVTENQLLIQAQELLSVQAQTALYAQKLITERAQTDGTLIGSLSTLGSQRDLMKAQTDGFARDAEQKVAKLMMDTWIVRKNSDDTESPSPENLLQDVNIGAAIRKMYEGIDVVPQSVPITP